MKIDNKSLENTLDKRIYEDIDENTNIKDVFYGKNEVQKLDIYVGASKNTIVYIHGGGLEAGSKDKLPALRSDRTGIRL